MQPATKSSSGLERKEVEKYRRMHMKAHVSRLASLIPTQEKLPLPALLDQVTSYVKQLKDRLEELRKRREQLQVEEAVTEDQRVALMVPLVAIKETGSALEVNLVTGVSKSCMLSQIFSVLQEEGAEVVSANCSTVGARTFYSIYSQALYSRIGIDTSRIIERLQSLVHPAA